jgi:hypothetical protein
VSATYQKLPQISLLGDAPLLGITVSRLVAGRYKPEVCSHAAALFEAVGILQGEHKGKRCKRPNPLKPASRAQSRGSSALGRRFAAGGHISRIRCVREPIVSKTGPRAAQSASGMCSGAFFLVEAHRRTLGQAMTEGLHTAPLERGVDQLRAPTDQRLPGAN